MQAVLRESRGSPPRAALWPREWMVVGGLAVLAFAVRVVGIRQSLFGDELLQLRDRELARDRRCLRRDLEDGEHAAPVLRARLGDGEAGRRDGDVAHPFAAGEHSDRPADLRARQEDGRAARRVDRRELHGPVPVRDLLRERGTRLRARDVSRGGFDSGLGRSRAKTGGALVAPLRRARRGRSLTATTPPARRWRHRRCGPCSLTRTDSGRSRPRTLSSRSRSCPGSCMRRRAPCSA